MKTFSFCVRYIYERRKGVEKIEAKDNLIRWMQQYKNLIFSICLKMTGDYFTAEDIAQDTLISAYTHYDSFDGQNEKAWLCRIASNKCTDYLRSAAYKTKLAAEEDMESEALGAEPVFEGASNNPADIYETAYVMESFIKCCKELPEGYDRAAMEHFVGGRTAREIAEESGENIKTIQTRIYRAKELLKKKYRKEWLEA